MLSTSSQEASLHHNQLCWQPALILKFHSPDYGKVSVAQAAPPVAFVMVALAEKAKGKCRSPAATHKTVPGALA
jgi:hypothetical protein